MKLLMIRDVSRLDMKAFSSRPDLTEIDASSPRELLETSLETFFL